MLSASPKLAKAVFASNPLRSVSRRSFDSVSPSSSTDVTTLVADIVGSQWKDLEDSERALVLEARDVSRLSSAIDWLMNQEPFESISAGTPAEAVSALGVLPPLLASDILNLAARFDAIMQAGGVRIRLELVVTNSCRKIHSDYTDLRLITTYAGPGTQVLPMGAEKIESNLCSVPTGWVGLFKGRLFGKGHSACLHRSPPAGDLRVRRLVLVIDTLSLAHENSSV